MGRRFTLLIFLILLGLPGTVYSDTKSSTYEVMVTRFDKHYGVKVIRASALIRRLKSGKPTLLIDVREIKEQKVSIIPGALRLRPSTALISHPTIQRFLKLHEKDAGTEIIVYCTAGYRSARSIAREKGMTVPVFNLHGGIIAYANAGGKLVDPLTNKAVKRVHSYDSIWGWFVGKGLEVVN